MKRTLSKKQRRLLQELRTTRTTGNPAKVLNLLQIIEDDARRPKTFRAWWWCYVTHRKYRKYYFDSKYPAIILMWAYYIACEWHKRSMKGSIRAHYRDGWTADDWVTCFKEEAENFSMHLRNDFTKRRVYRVFHQVPARLDMSNLSKDRQSCEMFYCVNELFTEHHDSCLTDLQKAGWTVDCLILDQLWAENGIKMLSAIQKHAEEKMSILFIACAFYAVSNWGKLLSENDPVVCRLFDNKRNDLGAILEFLQQEIFRVAPDEFTRWIRELIDNKEKYYEMFENIESHVLDDIITYTKAFRQID